jgi:hypothetical protein
MNAYVGSGRVIKRPCISGGGSSVLLRGPSIGSYSSATTTAPEKLAGSGISKALGNKLNNLMVKPLSRKPKNIVFDI